MASTARAMHASPGWLCLAAAVVLAVLALAIPSRAVAGEFTIQACQADAGDFASTAFEDFATRGMKWRRACNPLGPEPRGLVTSNVVRSGRVAQGAQSAFVMNAPPGTTFSRLRWSGHLQRRDCRYTLQLYAERPDGSDASIKNVRANQRCPLGDAAQASSWPRPRAYDLGGASRIIQRVACVGASSARFCSARGLNYIQTFTAEATVVDSSTPSVAIIPSGPLARGEWVSGTQNLDYGATDNVGIKSAQVWLGGSNRGGDPRECDYANPIPCPSGSGQIAVDAQHASEGSQPLRVSVVDAAGNSGESPTVTAHIDNTPPGTVAVGLEGGEAWRNRNDFDLAWENAPEPDRAPISAAHYRICQVGGGECVSGDQPGESITRVGSLKVPAPGEWELRLWREDAAGNQQPENASLPVRLRFDPEPPQLGFEAPSTADPTRVSVQVTDSISGLGGGEIAISQAGSGIWQELPTSQEGGHLVTHVDDATLPAGEYELRATAHDQATNLASTDKRLDGKPMRMKLPVRVASSVRAGVVRKRSVRRTARHGGKAHKVRRIVTVLEPRARVRFGRHVRLAGRLVDRAGNPLGGASVEVYSKPREGDEGQVGTLTTNAQGHFAYALDAKASQKLRFVYPGAATRLPAEDKVALVVPGRSTIAVSRSHILNGQSVTFSGRVQGRPQPALGKLLELQVLLPGEWQTFRTIRSEPDGRWRLRYTFRRTCGVQSYHLRIHLPGEAGYGLAAGASRVLAVRVKGRPCFAG